MLNKMNIDRVERAIRFMEKVAFAHVGTGTGDDVATILAILYDYRRELMRGERKQRVVSQ